MTEIAKPYDVTPEAIAARRAAGKGSGKNIAEELSLVCTALTPLAVVILMISACLFFAFIW